MLLITFVRLAQVGGRPAKGPLEAAPELVVEIISDSETQRILADKITDYISEVLALTPVEARTVATYGDGQAVASVVFPGLAVTVAEVLAA